QVEQRAADGDMGGTMRLGAYPCDLKPGSLAHSIYGKDNVSERHRHRWEFNNSYLEQYEKAGMVASGKNPGTGLVEIIELPAHPFFIGVQYHPELKSTVENPQPIFVHFIKAAKAYAEKLAEAKNPLLQGEMI
ncbi:MAG: gamma-glutamyl-gamma-aminobutyrate hydrolase family protein, partial [Chitinophagaceae bacterium]